MDIEVERVKFEEYFKDRELKRWRDVYLYEETNRLFEGWLSCKNHIETENAHK